MTKGKNLKDIDHYLKSDGVDSEREKMIGELKIVSNVIFGSIMELEISNDNLKN